MNQLPPPTRLSRMAPPSNSIMVTIRARPHLQPVPVRRSYDIYIPPSYAFEPYPKPASFDPALTTRIDVLHPDPVDRRTVALETEDQHAFNLRCKMEKERTLRDRYHNAYSRYYYGDAVNKEIYRKYLRESLKQQISEKESNKFRQISEKQRESVDAVERDRHDLESDVMKTRQRSEFLRNFRDFNKSYMDETAQKRKSISMSEKLHEREILQFNPINWSATLK